MRRYLYCLFIIIGFFVLGCQARYISPFLNGLAIEEFEQIDALMVYNKDNLFDYMNGEAEAYLPLGFQLLYILKYEDPELGIQMIAEAYDMKSQEGAEKIFKQYSNEEGSEIIELGQVAWTDNHLVLFQRDQYFLRVMPDYSIQQEKEPGLKDLLNLSRRIDATLKKQ